MGLVRQMSSEQDKYLPRRITITLNDALLYSFIINKGYPERAFDIVSSHFEKNKDRITTDFYAQAGSQENAQVLAFIESYLFFIAPFEVQGETDRISVFKNYMLGYYEQFIGREKIDELIQGPIAALKQYIPQKAFPTPEEVNRILSGVFNEEEGG